MKSKPKFTSLLLTHLATSAVMDLLLRLITCVDGTENKQNILTVTFPSSQSSVLTFLINNISSGSTRRN